jgi:proteasome assembly chaperone (PAC2) family protein
MKMVEIETRKFKDMDLKGGTVLEGFPGIGIVGPIAATYLIDYLEMDQCKDLCKQRAQDCSLFIGIHTLARITQTHC